MDLLKRIHVWGQTCPNRLAHVSGDERLTYRDLCRHSDKLALALLQHFPENHSPIVVHGHKEPEMLIAFLGALKAGHPYVPVDESMPSRRIEDIIACAGSSISLTPQLVADLTHTRLDVPVIIQSPLVSDDPFYIIFTSGSTGTPKGVVITYGCLTSFIEWMVREHPFVETGEVFLNQAPFSFDLSVMDLYLSLYTGGTLFSLRAQELGDPAQLYRALACSGTTTWVSTPSFAQLCLAEGSFGAGMLPSLRRFIFCGETLSPAVALELVTRFPAAEVWNTYGPTETTVATTSVRIDHAMLKRYRSLPVGYPKPDAQVLVVDDDGQVLAAGERGQIVIAGPHVSPGYLRQPELNAQRFFTMGGQRAYYTGDWGVYRDGLLFCDGRRDSQIKLHGHRIELGDVESNLKALSGVRDGVVTLDLKEGKPARLVAFVVFSQRPPGSDFDLSRALRAQLAERLPAYMLPQRFCFLPSLPMTANGKTDRAKLMELLV